MFVCVFVASNPGHQGREEGGKDSLVHTDCACVIFPEILVLRIFSVNFFSNLVRRFYWQKITGVHMEVVEESDCTTTFLSALTYARSKLCISGEFKAKQLEAMREIYNGNNVFLWLPTEYGKSVCYQELPFLFYVKLKCNALPPNEQSVCLVISPLLSLMTDQSV